MNRSLELQRLEANEDFLTLIARLREMIADDPHFISDVYVKEWCGRRWRNFFITEALQDERAMNAATDQNVLHSEHRPKRKRVAERFFHEGRKHEWRIDMPPPQHGQLEHTTFVFVPGLLNGLLPVRAFQTPMPQMAERFNIPVIRCDVHPLRGCEGNVEDIERAIERGEGLAADGSPVSDPGLIREKLVMMGYSKGLPDARTYLVKHPEMKDRVRAVIGLAGANGGSFMADSIYDIMRRVPTGGSQEPLLKILTTFYRYVDVPNPYNRMDEMDILGAMQDLTTQERDEFNREYRITFEEYGIPFFHLTGVTKLKEVPLFQLKDAAELDLHDMDNDMQLTQEQAMTHLVLSTRLAALHTHHWDIAYDPFPKVMQMASPNLDHPFPKLATLMATVHLMAELGLVD
jgi:hypothetical protein